ncbi:MAG: hypothetical protein ACRC0A_07775 [Chitinophagaceae bacterium]
MKIIYSFLIGFITGGIIIFLFLSQKNKNNININYEVITSDNTEVENKDVILIEQGNKITIQGNFDSKGTSYTNIITLDKRAVQYNHSITIGAGYLMASKTPFIETSYSYKQMLIGIKMGYSIELRDFEFGLSAGYKFNF